ncbi:MAG: hypothetical protein ACFCAD_07445 [Pleurocapsa sp.]
MNFARISAFNTSFFFAFFAFASFFSAFPLLADYSIDTNNALDTILLPFPTLDDDHS